MSEQPKFSCITPSVAKPCFFCVPHGECLERKRIRELDEKTKKNRSAK